MKLSRRAKNPKLTMPKSAGIRTARGRLQRLVRRWAWPQVMTVRELHERVAKGLGAMLISVEVAEGISGQEQNGHGEGQEHYPFTKREPPSGSDADELLVCTGFGGCTCKLLMEMDAPKLDEHRCENHSDESRPTPAQQ